MALFCWPDISINDTANIVMYVGCLSLERGYVVYWIRKRMYAVGSYLI